VQHLAQAQVSVFARVFLLHVQLESMLLVPLVILVPWGNTRRVGQHIVPGSDFDTKRLVFFFFFNKLKIFTLAISLSPAAPRGCTRRPPAIRVVRHVTLVISRHLGQAIARCVLPVRFQLILVQVHAPAAQQAHTNPHPGCLLVITALQADTPVRLHPAAPTALLDITLLHQLLVSVPAVLLDFI